MCDTLKELKPLQAMLPAMLAALGTALQTDEANARAMLDSLIEIAGLHAKFFKPQLKELAGAMLEHVTMNKNLEPATRRLGLECRVESRREEDCHGLHRSKSAGVRCIVRCGGILIKA